MIFFDAPARNDGSWRFDEAGFMEFTIGHFRSLRTRWRGVICAFGSREEFCDRNAFGRPPISTGLRRSAERGRRGCPDDANRDILRWPAWRSPAEEAPARGLREPVNRGRFTSKHGAVRECRPNKTSSRLREKSKLRNAAEARRASPQIKQRRKARRRYRAKTFSPHPSERKDACNVVDVFRFCQPFS